MDAHMHNLALYIRMKDVLCNTLSTTIEFSLLKRTSLLLHLSLLLLSSQHSHSLYY